MRTHKKWRFRLLSVLLVLSMAVGIMPTAAFAAQETGTEATSENVAIVQSYAAQMMNANKQSDYTAGKFSWDTEGKSDSWRYFNGVMFDAFMMVGGDEMTNYVDTVLSANIGSDGTPANYHAGELDSVPMALALFDLLDTSANAEKYKLAIQYVYTQLEGQTSYSDCGGNYLHKQDTSGNPTNGWETWNIGLDGLYMAQPFLMECANAIDAGKLTLTDKDGSTVTAEAIYAAVYNRFAWVAEYMYDSTTGLYHHGWNVSSNKGNGHFWGRGIGWYAMALVDVIDMMPGTYQTQMTPYLTKLFDGMLQYQDSDTGMWYNVVNRDSSLSGTYSNILETSVTSMMAYALMKAYNKGYVTDAKYGTAGLAAFNGVVANKVTGSEGSYAVKDTYLKSGVGTTDEYYLTNKYTVNEAKGTGALIMASTQANAAAAKLNENTETEPTVPESVTDEETCVTVSGSGATAITVEDKSSDDAVATALADKLESGFVAYDITLTGYTQGTEATVIMPAPDGADTVYYVAEDVPEEITGATFDGGSVTFTTTHFSTYAVGKAVTASEGGDTEDSVSAFGTLPGGTNYELVTNGQIEDGAEYLIVNTATNGTGYALRNQNSNTAETQKVTISDDVATIDSNESSCVWKFTKSGNGYVISNGTRYINLINSSFVSTTSAVTTVDSKDNNVFWLYKGSYYLRYSSSSFSGSSSTNSTSRRNIYLFKKTTTPGAAVTLTVTPRSASMKPTETVDLTANVLVDNAAATGSAITWKSSNEEVATVDGSGKVTAVAGGTATITATLASANGTSLTDPIRVEISVTVTARTISSWELTGNDPVTTKKGVEPDFSNIKLTITYDDGSTDVITTDNGLVISGYKDEIGVYYATISYQGKEYGTVKVTVDGNPYEGLEEATEYPEYPDDGAVRIDKTATGQDFNSTGVVKVELDAAGISVKQGVDVILVVDVSNSMGWTDNWFEDMTDAEVKAAKDNVKIPQGSADDTTDKLDMAMQAAQEFTNILLADNKTGDESNNSISFVTFAGADLDNGGSASYIDSVQTVFTNVQDVQSANTAFSNTMFTNYTTSGTSVTYTLQIGSIDGSTTSGTNRGNTNYDYAFGEANAAVTALKDTYGGAEDYAATGRQTVVVFMTDGAPSHYNDQRANGNANDNLYGQSATYPTANATDWLNKMSTPNTYAQTLNSNIDAFYAVGFDLNHGGFGDYSWTQEELKPVLEGLAGENSVKVELAENGDVLKVFYNNLAHQIKYAGTNARATDTIGSNFTLQTTSFGTESSTPSSITVTAYDLYTKAEISDNSLIGTRKGTSTELETVTFNGDGTEAYSNVLGETKNIMTTDDDGTVTIEAQYFTYTKDTEGVEKFVWNIGNITDKEVALSFYAYLKGSIQGTCEKGVYYTNEGATIEYVDINGKHASKDFPSPAVAWGGASTSFEYYLVNYEGKPVNRAGKVVPFANRIVLYGDTVALNLNQDLTIPAQNINASDYLPEGYFLYDVNACYTVSAASSAELKNGITISEPSDDARKQITTKDGATVSQTGAQTTIVVSHDENYIQSRVAFGVSWENTPIYMEYELVKDQIVMDYGKAIQVDVLENDTAIPTGHTGTLVGFTAYNAKANLKQAQQSAGSAPYTTSNGTYTIVDGKVNFQLNTMLSSVEKVFCVVKVTKNDDISNYYYLYEELDIIPATIMYYETDFADDVFTFETTGDPWKKVTADGDNNADGPQDDGTIGQNRYGYDRSYENDKYQSDDSSWEVTGAGSTATTVNFSFTGTGFDIISRTTPKEGFIRVSVYSDAEKTDLEKRVTVLNKCESELWLYQIPVVSMENLSYGTHYVEIGVSAPNTDSQYESLKNYGQFHFDAIRIYNPIHATADAAVKSDAAIAYAAYVADGEADASITEVRGMLIAANTFDATADTEDPEYVEGVSFVDSNPDGVGLADYTTIGPNNEVYLVDDQAIGFKIKLTSEVSPASIDIGAKSADGNTAKLHIAVLDADFNEIEGAGTDENGITINSSTAQYFDVMGDASISDAFGESDHIYVFIDNYGDGILSITDLKIASGEVPASVQILSDENVVAQTVNYVNDSSTQAEDANYDIISAEFTSTSVKRNKNASITVITTEDVEALKVQNSAGREVNATISAEASGDGTKVWTVTFKATSLGTQQYTVTGYGADGTAGAPATVSIKVTAR